jgi:pimeloyl-ACP methyl ester carboxylesterase
MDYPHRLVRLADGRDLDVIVDGPASRSALVLIDGSPTGVAASPKEVGAAAAHDLRFVTFGRPGYADSTRLPGRSVADLAPDIRALAAEIGLDRLFVIGWSGGGPHALACAALLPDLVAGAATMAGVAPYEAEGLDWFAGMAPANLAEFRAAATDPVALQGILERFAADHREVTGDQIADALGELLPPVDRASLTGEFAEHTAALIRDAVRTGIWGWFDDDLAFVRDWGFGLGDIRVPVALWQGTEDAMVPFAHGRWLADHVPGATSRLLEGEGHLSLGVTAFDRIVDELVEGPRP